MDADRIRARIIEIAGRPKHVRFEELEGLLEKHISGLFANYNHHGDPHHAFTVQHSTFNIAKPHSGFVKKCYVKAFLTAMEEVGLYDPDQNDKSAIPSAQGGEIG